MEVSVDWRQNNAPWGLARLSSSAQDRIPEVPDPRAFDYQYDFYQTAGIGTDAFIIDTGCRVSHIDFEGRASCFPLGSDCTDISGREYPCPRVV